MIQSMTWEKASLASALEGVMRRVAVDAGVAGPVGSSFVASLLGKSLCDILAWEIRFYYFRHIV